MSTTPTAERGTAPQEFRPGTPWLIGIVLAILTYWLFGQTLLNTIPTVSESLDLSRGVSTIAVPLAALFSGIFIVLAGGMADRFGRVRMLRIGIVLSIVGSLLVALTPAGAGAATTVMLLGGRIVQGISIAAIMPATLSLINTLFTGAERQRAVSFFSMGTFGGSGLTSVVGGFLTSTFGWRSSFFISVAVALLALFLIRGTPESKAAERVKGFDLVGVLTFMVGIIALNVLISQGSTLGWLSAAAIILLLVAVGALAAFVVAEKRLGSRAFIDLRLFNNPRYAGAVAANALVNGTAGVLVVTQTVAQRAGGLSSGQAGMLTVGFLVSILATIRVGEALLRRLGTRTPMLMGIVSLAIGAALNSLTMLPQTGFLIAAAVGFVFFGTGLGLFATPATDAAITSVPKEETGLAAAIFKMGSTLGNAIGITVATSIMYAVSTLDPSATVPWDDAGSLRAGGSAGLWSMVAFAVIAGIITLLVVPGGGRADAEN